MIYTYKDKTINFNMIYKNRKSIGIYVDFYGQVEVHASKDTPEELIFKALEERWDLINQKLDEMKSRRNGEMERVYEHGEDFLYLGFAYPIMICNNNEDKKDYVLFEDKKINVYVKNQDEDYIKKALKRFYYRECKSRVEKSIKKYQSEFKTKPRAVSISDSVSNWGTCNSRFEMTFNWKLAMAPLEVIDYVVVHEMCHMVHLNHDRSFWRLVGKIMPDYEEKSNWLALSRWKMTM